MEELGAERLLLNYIRDKKKAIMLLGLYEVIYVLLCALYQLENLHKLMYGVYISVFLGICYGLWDFWNYRKHINAIKEAGTNMENVLSLLPAAQYLPERHYHELLRSLFDERQQLLHKGELRMTEMTDYYTLWAHQIKTPIAAMKLLLQNDENQNVSYALQEELFKIEQYVEMVLHYLRLESISSDLHFKEYELQSIVNRAVKKHALLFINSGLSFNMEDIRCKVLTDEKWLQFVMEQLISNAIKYTPKGSITIRLEEDQVKKRLIIEDTGIGIRSEDLPRIFERGFTGYNGRLDKKSTGIGLYLCKQILDRLSHRIEVQSYVGKGTRVCIDFIEEAF